MVHTVNTSKLPKNLIIAENIAAFIYACNDTEFSFAMLDIFGEEKTRKHFFSRYFVKEDLFGELSD